jgi:phosphonate transport system ATP-binding protein
MEALREINRQDGVTVLVNLHDLDMARAYCGRIVAMRAGRLAFDGAPEQLSEAGAREIYGSDSRPGPPTALAIA